MKKAEAMTLIRKELGEGVEKEVIVEILLQEEKIGNQPATRELVEALVDTVEKEPKKSEAEPTQKPAAEPTSEPSKKSIFTYEKWKVDEKDGSKIKMLKAIVVGEETANRLNSCGMTSSKGYTIKYFKVC